MEYKIVPNFPLYHVYKNGDIINHKTNKKVPMRYDYVVKLSNDVTRATINAKKVIYETFYCDKLCDNERIAFINEDNVNKLNYTNLIKIKKYHYLKSNEVFEFDKNKKWKNIKGFNSYIISDFGDVYSVNINRLIKPYINEEGYHTVNIVNDQGKSKNNYVHILVYDTFVGIKYKKSHHIDHFDRKRNNNELSNLREITISENSKNKNHNKT